jgi:hypothetical protein
MAQPEHEEQAALILWAARAGVEYPELAWLFAVPNGGKRDESVALALQREGVKPGVPDLLFLIPRGGFHGAAIEMKYGRNTTTAEQNNWLAQLGATGFATCVAYSWSIAAAFLLRYLGASEEEVSRLS